MEGVEIWRHSFLTHALNWCGLPPFLPRGIQPPLPLKYEAGLGLRANLDALESWNTLPEIERGPSGCPAHSLDIIATTLPGLWLCIRLASKNTLKNKTVLGCDCIAGGVCVAQSVTFVCAVRRITVSCLECGLSLNLQVSGWPWDFLT